MIQPGDEPIPGYRIERRLGSGQYGEVWQASSPGRSKVALKFLDMTGRHGWKEFRAVQRVKQVRHAHLMPIVAIWLLDSEGRVLDDDALDNYASSNPSTETIAAPKEEPSQPTRMVIATLLGDGSLRDRLNECHAQGLPGVPTDELMTYMREAAKGLDYLNSVQHESGDELVGIQHCDIKPDNILLSGGVAVIGDFGVAQVRADTGGTVQSTSLSGSPAYMAPEAFEAKPSESSDQYSLAVTFYELWTGELPVDPGSFAAVYDAHRSGSLDFSLAPLEVAAALQQATSPDPTARFDTTSGFVQALSAAMHEPERESRTWLAPAAMALAAVAVVAAVGLFASSLWGPETVDISLRFDFPQAQVVVNGQPLVADAQGVLPVEAIAEEPLRVEASGNPGRKDAEWRVSPEELASQSIFDLPLELNAESQAALAEQEIERGNLNSAAEALALAIRDEPSRYARLPTPEARKTAGVMWDDCLHATPDGNWLVAGGRDGVVRRWSITPEGLSRQEERVHAHSNSPVSSVAVGEDWTASACDSGEVWVSTNSGSKKAYELKGGEIDLCSTADHANLVAAVSFDLSTRLLNWPTRDNGLLREPRVVGEQPGEFARLAPCQFNSVALATMDDEALVWRWPLDGEGHSELGRRQREVLSIASSGDGEVVAFVGVPPTAARAEQPVVYEVSGGARYKFSSPANDTLLACRLSGSGYRLVTSERTGEFDPSGSVVVWRRDLATGTVIPNRVLEFDKQQGDAIVLAVTPELDWIAAGHESGGVSLWRPGSDSEQPVVTFGGGDRVAALVITPDKRWLIAAARDGRLLVYDLLRLEVVLRACEQEGVEPAPPAKDQASLST